MSDYSVEKQNDSSNFIEPNVNKFTSPRQFLKTITTVKIKTFENFGLTLEQVSYSNISDDGFDILIEISADRIINADGLIELKANCYDKEGDLIYMEDILLTSAFRGYNTFSINCYEENLLKDVGKITLYAASN